MTAQIIETRMPPIDSPEPNNGPAESSQTHLLDGGYSLRDAGDAGKPIGEEVQEQSVEQSDATDKRAEGSGLRAAEAKDEAVLQLTDAKEADHLAKPAAKAAGAVVIHDAIEGEPDQAHAPVRPAEARAEKTAGSARTSVAAGAEAVIKHHVDKDAAVRRPQPQASSDSPTDNEAGSDRGVGAGGEASEAARDADNQGSSADSGDRRGPPSPPDRPGTGEGDSSDDRERRLVAEHVAAYGRFAERVQELETVYRTTDYFDHPDFIAHGGDSDMTTSAVFKLTDPADGKLCVVGLHADDPGLITGDAIRYQGLLRGAGMAEQFEDVVEQPVAYDPDGHKVIREHMPGDQLAKLTTEAKNHILSNTLDSTLTTLEAMGNAGIIPDAAYDRNSLLNEETMRVGFVDYVPLEDSDDPEGSVDINAAHAFLGVLDALGTPIPEEAQDIDAWRAGARIFEEGIAVLRERHPELRRAKDLIIEPASDIAGGQGGEPEVAERPPELPFYQQHFDGTEPPIQASESDLVERTFTEFVDAIRETTAPSESEPGIYDAVLLARDGRQIMVQVREDDDGRVISRRVIIPWEGEGNTAATYYEADYRSDADHYGQVVRDENIPGAVDQRDLDSDQLAELHRQPPDFYTRGKGLEFNNQPVGMREIVGLTRYAGR